MGGPTGGGGGWRRKKCPRNRPGRTGIHHPEATPGACPAQPRTGEMQRAPSQVPGPSLALWEGSFQSWELREGLAKGV